METRTLQRIICAGLLGSALVLNGVASAAVVTNRVPLLGYADHNIAVYRSPGGVKAATVAAETALIQITQVRANGWAYGTYPTSNGHRAGGWFRMSDMQSNVNFNNVNGKILHQQTVYRTPSMSGGNGILTQGTSVLVIAEQGGLSQVIYKQQNSVNWRIGWVMTGAVEKAQVAAANQVNQNKTANQVTTAASDSANKALQAAQNTNAGASSQTKVKQQTNPGTVAKAANTQLQNITVSNERNTGLVLGNASETEIAKRYVKVYPNASLSTPYQGRFIDKDESYSVIEQRDNALHVKYKSGKGEDREGWVPSSIREGETPPARIILSTEIAKRYVYVYPDASLSTPYQGRFIDKDESYSVIEQRDNALHVKYKSGKGEDREGWVPSSIREREVTPIPNIINNNTNPIVVPVQRQVVTNGIKGDLNQDGKVDQTDLDILGKIIIGKIPATDLYKAVGDMDGDGIIDIMDASQIMFLIKDDPTPVTEIAKRHVDVYDDAGKLLNGRYIDRGESYTVIKERGNRLKVNYKSAKGEDRQGWVSISIREEVFVPAELQRLINEYNNQVWKNHSYIKSSEGPIECKEFASYIFDQLYSVGYIGGGSTRKNINCHIISLSNPDKVVLRGSSNSLNVDIVKELFKNAQPGDFVQMKRKSGSPHSAILVSVDEQSVQFFEANVVSYNKIKLKSYTYDQLVNGINGYYQNQAMSIYYAK